MTPRDLIASVDPLTNRTTFIYDNLGRQEAVQTPLGFRSTNVFDGPVAPAAHRFRCPREAGGFLPGLSGIIRMRHLTLRAFVRPNRDPPLVTALVLFV